MSFFSNPLAEEDEVVPPDYPLEQYDERKREDDFNELLVRSTKLEAAQRATGGEAEGAAATMVHPELVQCLKENQQIRSTLEEMWGDISADDKQRRRDSHRSTLSAEASTSFNGAGGEALTSASHSPVLINTVEEVRAQMHAQAAQQEAAVKPLEHLVVQAAGQLASSAASAPSSAAAPTASAFTTLHSAASSTAASNIAAEASAVNVAEVEAAVQALEGQLPSMSAEEAALAAAAVHQLECGLRSLTALQRRWATLHHSVAAKAQEQAEAQQAARAFARWTAARQLASTAAAAADVAQDTAPTSAEPSTSSPSSAVAAAAPPLSFDLALAESLNKELNEENWRLEAVLAGLLASPQAAPHTSLAGSALVQRVALLEHAKALEAEVERLGSAVLYLRAVLAAPSPHTMEKLAHPQPSITSTESEAACLVAARESVWAARLTHLSTLEASLQSSLASPAHTNEGDEGDAVANSVDAILSHGLAKLVELHDACLHAVALLSTYFEKQSTSAAFLVRAQRAGGSLDDATVERVLDLPLPDAVAVQESLAAVASTCADVSSEVERRVQQAAVAAAATLARWSSVRSTLLRLLRESAALLPSQPNGAAASNGNDVAALLLAYADQQDEEASQQQREEKVGGAPSSNTAATATDYVRTEPCWAAALEEEVAAFRDEKAAQRSQAKAFWSGAQAETNKKLTWLMKQPNARLLLDLCAVEKEKEELTERMKVAEDATVDAAALQDTLDALQRQLAQETAHNAELQEELTATQARKRDLEAERAKLLASLSE